MVNMLLGKERLSCSVVLSKKKCWNPTLMDGNVQDLKNHFPYFYLSKMNINANLISFDTNTYQNI